MGRSTSGSDAYSGGHSNELPDHAATVDDSYLDTYEVTVGRFRKFVNAYTGAPPAVGVGAHPKILGSGWDAKWTASLPATQAALIAAVKCSSSEQTWTDTAGANESSGMNYANWYQAVAFCAWDGGRLPTEAEWEYAAAGGDESRPYPWGSTTPDATVAVFNTTARADVGSKPVGASRWGQLDLAGNLWEWNLDWYRSHSSTQCGNCANISSGSDRVVRGGRFYDYAARLRAANRNINDPTYHYDSVGFRCARTP